MTDYLNNFYAIFHIFSLLSDYVSGGDGDALPLYNTYALLTTSDGSGYAGIGWIGTVCGSQDYRTNINEYYGDLDTAQVRVLLIN